MRLSSVTIRNFKRLREVVLVIPKTDSGRPGSADFLTIIGPNNAGKSSVLEAIRLALPGSDVPKALDDHFPGKQQTNGPIEVEFEFDELTPQDEAEQGIRTHVHNGRYRVKKTWTAPGVKPDISSFEPSKEIKDWDEKASREDLEKLGPEWEAAVSDFSIQSGPLGKRLTKSQREALKDYLLGREEFVVLGDPKWQLNPGGFAAHVDSILPRLIFVPAIRETKDEAGVSEKKSAARQIVDRMFSIRLAEDDAVKAFTEAGAAVKKLFVDGHDAIRDVENRISEKLARLIPLGAKLDFDPPDVPDLTSKTILEIVDGSVRTAPEHQGHGAQRALILSLLELLAELMIARSAEEGRPSQKMLLLIEEPEIYLHPQMERKMRDVLLQIARSGTAQVICTSHSPIFIDLADRHDGIVLAERQGEITRLRQRKDDLFAGKGQKDERSRLRMLLDFDPAVNEAFFSREVCLVEGDSEVASIEATAQKLLDSGLLSAENYLQARRNVAMVNCRGKWTILAFQRVLNGFDIPHRVVHDSDSEGSGGANARILDSLGGDQSRVLVHTPNFEQQIFHEAFFGDKPWKAVSRTRDLTSIPDDLLRFFCFVIGQSMESYVGTALGQVAGTKEGLTGDHS
ncbi:MAG: ATP-dependent nuclease [Bacillota bacterium]